MKSKFKKYSLIIMAIVMVAVTSILFNVNAAEPTTGSLTIICHEQKNGDTTTNPVISGIEYTLYKVYETCTNVDEAEDYVEYNLILGDTETTDINGKAIFSDLSLGRYYAKVTKVPDGACIYEKFLVDIPMTNATGTGLNYDITVEPKIGTAFGNLELTKLEAGGQPIEGVTFKVQVRSKSMLMSLEEVGNNWQDYIPVNSSTVLTATTDENGKILLQNIPAYINYNNNTGVMYRLVEVSGPEGYIVNNKVLSNFYFEVEIDGSLSTSFNEYNQIDEYERQFLTLTQNNEDLTKITYINEKPTITKKVKNSAGAFVDNAGLNMKDTITFKVTTDVPMQISDMSTYKITDTLPAGLTINRSSIVVEGTTASGSEVIPSDYYTLSDAGLILTFDTSKMYDTESNIKAPIYNNVIVTYDASFNSNVVIGGDGNINTATLEYTNEIAEDGSEESTKTISDTAEVHTGALKIEKVEKGSTSTKLAGAKFKVATSEDNAKAGTFVTDETGSEIEVTTDSNGIAEIKGLAYADDGSDISYWLVETQAPSYTETVDGQAVTKYYNLLKNPIEVQVGKTTYNTAVQVLNSKGLDLPATGGIGIAIFVTLGAGVMLVAVVMNKKQKVQE